jgi:hypothetical protein
VVEREGVLEALRRHRARGEDRAGVVGQHVDARLGRSDCGGDAPGFCQHGKIGVVDDVSNARRGRPQPRQCRLAPRAVARDEHQPRAQFRQAHGGDLADAGGRASDHHDLALHRSAPILVACAAALSGGEERGSTC